jgi:hypothetical protein
VLTGAIAPSVQLGSLALAPPQAEAACSAIAPFVDIDTPGAATWSGLRTRMNKRQLET